MMGDQGAMPSAGMTGGRSAIWWGPVLLNGAMGTLLAALSRRIGSLLASGLDV